MAHSENSPKPDVAQVNWSAFMRAFGAGHDDYLKMAAKCNDYYLGHQWDEQDRKVLEEQGRPVLTINEILQVINAIRGHYSTTRADIDFKPYRQGATVETAHTLTRLLDQILDANDYHDRVEPQVFDDGLIEDRGFFDIRINYDQNVLGEVKIGSLDPRSVVIDPDAKEYDPATWTEVFVDRWMSLDDIELYYGKDKRVSVEAVAANRQGTFGDKSIKYDTFSKRDVTAGFPAGETDEKRVKSVRVIERQYRKLGFAQEFVDLETGETRAVPLTWDEERVKAIAGQYQLGVRKALRSRVRWTVSADHVVLFDDWSDYDDFTIVPYFPIFRRGRPSGIVRHLLDPQEQLNKTESQVLHVINTTANSGWVVEEGSLRNMTEDELEDRGAETGLVLVHGRNRLPPTKIPPNQVPSGLEHVAQKAQGHVHNISGAAALLGTPPKSEVSGVTIERSMAKALTGLQVVFDNLEYSRKLVAKRILTCIQKFYTEARVFYVTDWRNPEQTQEEVAINQQVAGEIVNDITLGEYQVKATTAPARDTFEETQFAEALQLREAGIPIPGYHIVLASHLAGKRQIAEELKQLEGLGEPTPEQQQMAQIEMQMAMATLQELQAKVQNLQAQAQLAGAKAQSAMVSEERENFEAQSQHERELQRMQLDIQKTMANLQNKLQLAGLHSEVKNGLTRYGKLLEINEREKDRQLDMGKAQLQASVQLKNAQLSAQRQAASKNSASKGSKR